MLSNFLGVNLNDSLLRNVMVAVAASWKGDRASGEEGEDAGKEIELHLKLGEILIKNG